MKKIFSLILLSSMFLLGTDVFAKPLKKIELLFEDRSLSLNFVYNPNLITTKPVQYLLLGDKKIKLTSDDLIAKSAFVKIETSFETVISKIELKTFLQDSAILKSVNAKPVEINLDPKTNKITFSGDPIFAYEVDFDALVDLVNLALKKEISTVRVPAKKQYSKVVVHPDLAARGITEVLSIGESNFRGSSWARKKNIQAGANKMNGAIIKKGKIFSFNEQLESVDEKYGFVEELVIKGNDTVKELGGGVCQVSTTMYRSAFYAGLPIKRRRAHSYAVPYYKPVGLDSAIYLGQLDLRFQNDTQGDMLIQSFTKGNNLYFVLYGTSDDRKVFAEGPFISDWKAKPEPRYFETDELAPGEKVVDSKGYAGFVAKWVRTVVKNGVSSERTFESVYRPWKAKVRIGKEISEKKPPSVEPSRGDVYSKK